MTVRPIALAVLVLFTLTGCSTLMFWKKAPQGENETGEGGPITTEDSVAVTVSGTGDTTLTAAGSILGALDSSTAFTLPDSLLALLAPHGPYADSFYRYPNLITSWNRFYAELEKGVADSTFTTREFILLTRFLERRLTPVLDSVATRMQLLEQGPSGYQTRFFRSPLSRQDILGDPITPQEAKHTPHFRVVYGPQGHLFRIIYIEPEEWQADQARLAQGTHMVSRANPSGHMVRYYTDWDDQRLEPVNPIKRKRLNPDQPVYRANLDAGENFRSVYFFDSRQQLIYSLTYDIQGADSTHFFLLEFPGDGSGSLLDLNPTLFLNEWSLVHTGGKVAVTGRASGGIGTVEVFSELKQLAYYYQFEYSTEGKRRSQRKIIKGTVRDGDSNIQMIYRAEFDADDRLLAQTFYHPDGTLNSTISYEYPTGLAYYVMTEQNRAGVILKETKLYRDPPSSILLGLAHGASD